MGDKPPVVLAVSRLLKVEAIDSGKTLAVRFEGADGRELAVLVPIASARELRARLFDTIRLVEQAVGKA
ncbi:hypothetical protein [Methylobacterium nonmethylotrophicum]|uniref:Uncharacterized protein n=1 Tax=Methylobacterium nonmethylotrophicum TaxID=1141884 RepID=A0A4Z0NCH8_9HYPH|nr:hypothetical protein [Methylobacterium nonmethylotrophicum]TGD91677.1 hypothetical protein EU555_35600 [Methylobacterium nonmethylotrophicum]